MARALKATLTLSLAVGLTSIALGQQQQPGIAGPGALLFNPDVKKELKLTDEQLDKLKAALGKVMAKYKDDFDKFQKAPPSPEEGQKIAMAFHDDSQKAIAGVLEAQQVKRFKQIVWQLNGLGALQDPELQKDLKLSDEQKKKLDTILNDAVKKMQELQQKREPSREKYEAVRKESEEKANGVLSEEQKKNLKELKGPPFEFSRPAPPPAQKR